MTFLFAKFFMGVSKNLRAFVRRFLEMPLYHLVYIFIPLGRNLLQISVLLFIMGLQAKVDGI